MPWGEAYPANSTPTLLWALFVGVLGGWFAGSYLGTTVRRRLGLGSALGVPSIVAWSGIAIGIRLGATASWVTPPHPGFLADAAGRPGDSWGVGPWIAWTSPYWLPALIALLVAVRAVGAVRDHRRHLERAARTEAVTTTGRRVSAEVTEVGSTGVEIDNAPLIRFTVKFTDHLGTDRWVTREGRFDPTRLPRAGDPAVVWFDPADLADLGERSLIPVALGTPAELPENARPKGSTLYL
ncbi:hypothetical protein [Peterkaempfera bronchialis]|uniref:hypothetical protein n=1 Tax=Peterkaempfera bronchialis TaxID=2126346 RepID=UPI003C3038C6